MTTPAEYERTHTPLDDTLHWLPDPQRMAEWIDEQFAIAEENLCRRLGVGDVTMIGRP